MVRSCSAKNSGGMRLHCSDVCLKNNWWRGRGTAPCREPSQVGRAPMGPVGGAESVAQHKGLQTAWGVLAITDGICTRPGEVAHGGIVALGERDRSESA